MKYKKGQYVRCVCTHSVAYLTKGAVYEVMQDQEEDHAYVKIVNDRRYSVLLLPSRFIPVENPAIQQGAEEYEEIMKLQELIHG